MQDISKLAKLTLKNLSDKNLEATPENYEKEFFLQAKKNNFRINEFDELNNILKNLPNAEKKIFNPTTYRQISKLLLKRVKEEDLKHFLKHLSYFMMPSLSTDIKNDINELCAQLSTNPNNLVDIDTIRKLRRITNIRISSDKSIFEEKTSDIKKLLTFLSRFLKKRVNENKITINEIENIKQEIKSLELSKASNDHFSKIYKKLEKLVDEFGSIVDSQNNNIEKSQDLSEKLYAKIEKLKNNLYKAEEEKSIDYLTKVLTRHAYTLEVEKIEKEYKAFNSKYAIVFIDIDNFKKVNDTYGHICGDSVLATLASILKKLTRNEDIITRYGGEEFVCLIHYKNIFDIKNYLNRVKNIVSNNKFVYKNIRLDIRFSAGVALRSNYETYEDSLKKADFLLYQAKNSGRDKIVLDNAEII